MLWAEREKFFPKIIKTQSSSSKFLKACHCRPSRLFISIVSVWFILSTNDNTETKMASSVCVTKVIQSRLLRVCPLFVVFLVLAIKLWVKLLKRPSDSLNYRSIFTIKLFNCLIYGRGCQIFSGNIWCRVRLACRIA